MRGTLLAVLLLILVAPGHVYADWTLDGTAMSSTGWTTVANSLAIADDDGGLIVSWTGDVVLYAQRIDVSGDISWNPAGVVVNALVPSASTQLAAASDGAGGVIFVWRDNRNLITTGADIYAQRLDAAGAPLWTANGVQLTALPFEQSNPSIVADGAGGALVVFAGNGGDLYGQRINASGILQWGANGLAIGTALTASAGGASAVSDGAGGIMFAWTDGRGGIANWDIYAQRLNSAGVAQWAVDGVSLCAAAGTQLVGGVSADGAGGAIATWLDPRAGTNDIYAQRVSGTGISLWTPDGLALCSAVGSQYSPLPVSDGAGGTIVVWQDDRAGASDVYAQRISPGGVPLWTLDGVGIVTAAGPQSAPRISTDGGGGAIMTWADGRGPSVDIYAQRVNAAGAVQWTADGTRVCLAAGNQTGPRIAPDLSPGAFVAWVDPRVPAATTLYAQRITTAGGEWGMPEPFITGVADVPADQGGQVEVNWAASRLDEPGSTTATHYSVWRAVDAFPSAAAIVASPLEIGPNHTGKTIWIEKAAAVDYYWEWLGNQVIINSPGYSFAAETRNDSTLTGSADHFFQVIVHAASPFLFWRSNVETGHSVDNLAPAAPLNFTAERVASAAATGPAGSAAVAIGDVLCTWQHSTEGDLRDYSIYRSSSPGVTPSPEFFLARTSEDSYLDTTAPLGQSFYYVLTANDVHGNSSAATSAVTVGPSTGVRPSPSLMTLAVSQNHPNPFATFTEWQIGLPSSSPVDIRIYDIAGRLVRHMSLGTLAAGWKSVAFDGRDNAARTLASGVYLYRVTGAGATITRKMVITR